jgi:redox-sensitive bicupin YhaK (pirin superfamily)
MPEIVIDPRQADLGHGLRVRRLLPFRLHRTVGPFVFFDHAGPVVLPSDAGRAADVRPHPHIGLATVSYLFSGKVTHRDSLGVEQVIVPGEVNWMTAGRGISHSERFEDPSVRSGSGLELLQSWVALPEADEEVDPSFANYPVEALPEGREDGLWMRVIAGEAFGLTSPVKTHSPMFYVHTAMEPGARLSLPAHQPERAAYVAAGRVETADGTAYAPGQMVVFGPREDTTLRAVEPSVVMLLGGEPLGPRHLWWNFVSSRPERIEQAKADWLAGRIALPPGDDEEFIPLPDSPPEKKVGAQPL